MNQDLKDHKDHRVMQDHKDPQGHKDFKVMMDSPDLSDNQASQDQKDNLGGQEYRESKETGETPVPLGHLDLRGKPSMLTATKLVQEQLLRPQRTTAICGGSSCLSGSSLSQ